MPPAPAAGRDVFRADPHVLHSGEGNEFLIPAVGKNSVLVLDDEPHLRQRRILLPPLKGERMRGFFDAMQSATLETVAAWPVGRAVRTVAPVQDLTLRVVMQAVLGLAPGPGLLALEEKVRRVLALRRDRHACVPAAFGPGPP